MVTTDEIRQVALTLPRTEEHLIRDRVKFRVGRIVYLAISRDETTWGFGFPKEERAALVEAEPDKFYLPRPSECASTGSRRTWRRSTPEEMRELVIDSWRMVVPKRVAAAFALGSCDRIGFSCGAGDRPFAVVGMRGRGRCGRRSPWSVGWAVACAAEWSVWNG